MEVDLRGVKCDDMQVEVTGNELVVSGEFKDRERTGWGAYPYRRVGRFECLAVLPREVDPDKISAELAEGVLTVRVPKSDTAKPATSPRAARQVTDPGRGWRGPAWCAGREGVLRTVGDRQRGCADDP